MKERLFPLLVLGALVLTMLTWLVRDRKTSEGAFGQGSVRNTSATGLSLALTYLRQRQVPVAEWHHALDRQLPEPEAILLRVRPRSAAGLRLLEQLAEYEPDETDSGLEEEEELDGGRHAARAEPRELGPQPAGDGPADADAALGQPPETQEDPATQVCQADPIDPPDGGPCSRLRELSPARSRGPRLRPFEQPRTVLGFLTEAEASWIQSGGRLVLALDADYGELEVEQPASPEPADAGLPSPTEGDSGSLGPDGALEAADAGLPSPTEAPDAGPVPSDEQKLANATPTAATDSRFDPADLGTLPEQPAPDPVDAGLLEEDPDTGPVRALDDTSAANPAHSSGSWLIKVFPRWPAVRSIHPPVTRGLTGPALPNLHTLFASNQHPVIARQRLRQGEVIVLACPEVLDNDHLHLADHLKLLEALAVEQLLGTNHFRPIYFDETAHGLEEQVGAVDLLRRWGLGPFLLLSLLAALAAFWRARTRIGPPEDDYRETRRETVEFVDSLALLYRRTLRRADALALYQDAFRRTVATTTGLRGDLLEQKFKELTAGLDLPPMPAKGTDLSYHDFRRGLAALNEAFRRL